MTENEIQLTISAIDNASIVLSRATQEIARLQQVNVAGIPAQNSATAAITKNRAALDGLTTTYRQFNSAARLLTGGLLTVAFERMLVSVVNADNKLGGLSASTGISVEQLSRLGFIAEHSNTSIEALTQSLPHLSKFLVESGQGSKDLFEALVDLSAQMQRTPAGADRLNLALDRLGHTGEQLIPLLSQGPGALRELAAKADQFGITSQRAAEQAAELKGAVVDLNRAGQGLIREFLLSVGPATTTALEFWADALSKFRSTDIDSRTKAMAGLAEQNDHFALTLIHAIDAQKQSKALSEEQVKILVRQIELARQLTDPQKQEGALASISTSLRTPDAINNRPKTSAELDVRRAALDQQIQQNKLIDEQVGLRDSGPERLELERIGIQKQIDLLNEKRQLTSNARFKDGIVTEQQAIADENKDMEQLVGLLRQKQALGGQGFSDTFADEIKRLNNEFAQFATIGQTAAHTIGSAFDAAFHTIGQGLTGVILGTSTWHDLLLSIGSSVLTAVIEGITKMFASWIAGEIAKHFVVTSNAATEASAKAPVALFDSISSFGVAAAVGVAALLAALAATGSFSSGGHTGSGSDTEIDGLVHKNEFVVSAQRTREVGLSNLMKMFPPKGASYSGPSSGGYFGGGFVTGQSSFASGQRDMTVNIARIETRQDLRDFMALEGSRIVENNFEKKGRFRV